MYDALLDKIKNGDNDQYSDDFMNEILYFY